MSDSLVLDDTADDLTLDVSTGVRPSTDLPFTAITLARILSMLALNDLIFDLSMSLLLGDVID